jgi:hypothetical protein
MGELMEFVPLVSMLMVLAITLFAGTGLDRSFVIHSLFMATIGIGALLMVYQADWFVLAGWTVLSVNILRRPYPMHHQWRLALLAALYAVYAFVPPIQTDWLLMGIAGLMVLFSLSYGFLLFQHESFRDMLVTIGVACTVALVLKGYWLWTVALGPLVFSVLIFRERSAVCQSRILQAHIWLAGIAVLAMLYWVPWLAVAPILAAGAWYWSNPMPLGASIRWRWWHILLSTQWQSGWSARLFGMGHDAWMSWADSLAGVIKQKTGKVQEQVLLNPHNEYVSILFEHGLVGLTVFAAWAGSLLWHAYTYDPVLVIPGLTLAAIALTLFPWTFPREIELRGQRWVRYEPFGHMSTIILSLLIAILLKGAS